MELEQLELSKENVLPLRRGRKLAPPAAEAGAGEQARQLESERRCASPRASRRHARALTRPRATRRAQRLPVGARVVRGGRPARRLAAVRCAARRARGPRRLTRAAAQLPGVDADELPGGRAREPAAADAGGVHARVAAPRPLQDRRPLPARLGAIRAPRHALQRRAARDAHAMRRAGRLLQRAKGDFRLP